jgi:hypothetical protein
MSIETMMCLSTGHVTRETAEALEQWVENQSYSDPNERPHDTPEWVDDLIAYPHGEYGWMICVVGFTDGPEGPPEDMLYCIEHAKNSGCDWLLLDRDAELIDELPSFDW